MVNVNHLGQISELKQKDYKTPQWMDNLTKIMVVLSVICGIGALIGDGVQKKELCFYPENARVHDDRIRNLRKKGNGEQATGNRVILDRDLDPNARKENKKLFPVPRSLFPSSIKGKIRSEQTLLFGKKYCTPKQRYTMPVPMIKKAMHESSNPIYNPRNYLAYDALASKAVYEFRTIPPDNPFKLQFAIFAMIFGAAGASCANREIDFLHNIRPHYRATKKLESIRSQSAITLSEQLQLTNGEQMIKYWRGIADAQARVQFIVSLTPQQRLALSMGMSAEEYHQYGFLLDQGSSAHQAQLHHDSPGTVDEQARQPKMEPSETKSIEEHFRKIGEAIIRSMIVTDKSILIASSSGTGKTTTENYFLKQLCKKYPCCELYALLNKNDELFGVRRERQSVFEPEAFNEEGWTLQQMLSPLYTVYNIFLERKKLPTQEREHLRSTQPVRLILGDWYGTYQELQSRLKKDDLQGVLSMIRQIITIGRDMGVGLVVDTQSANLDSLGIASDASIRQSLDIFSQGYISFDGEEQKGELQTIRLMFSNSAICSAGDREEITASYNWLSEQIITGKLKTPIIFTSVGAKPRIGIVPNLKDVSQSSLSNVDWVSARAELDEQYRRLEFMENLPTTESKSVDETKIELSPSAKNVLRFLETTKQKDADGWVTVRVVRQAKRGLSPQQIQGAIDEMLVTGIIECDAKESIDGTARIRVL